MGPWSERTNGVAEITCHISHHGVNDIVPHRSRTSSVLSGVSQLCFVNTADWKWLVWHFSAFPTGAVAIAVEKLQEERKALFQGYAPLFPDDCRTEAFQYVLLFLMLSFLFFCHTIERPLFLHLDLLWTECVCGYFPICR